MRITSILVCVFILTLPAHAASTVTVAQLEQFLSSSRTTKLTDQEIAGRLSKVELSEQLTAARLARIRAESSPGPETEEQLELLTASSLFLPPPASEIPDRPAPDEISQQQIINAARDYARRALHLLPDFLAVRETRSFDNIPVETSTKHSKPEIHMHFVSESRRPIGFRNGREVDPAINESDTRSETTISPGFSTRGEFGAILAQVLNDSFNGKVQWVRWQGSEPGRLVAVFRYSIPRPASHYSIDFCCYQKSLDDPTDYAFKDKPGYHGEIYVDPASGEISQITLEAEIEGSDPAIRSAMAVQYGKVLIGAKQYVCPIKSVAISDFHSALIEKIDGIGIERRVNEVEFSNYHKFGSTSRILDETSTITK